MKLILVALFALFPALAEAQWHATVKIVNNTPSGALFQFGVGGDRGRMALGGPDTSGHHQIARPGESVEYRTFSGLWSMEQEGFTVVAHVCMATSEGLAYPLPGWASDESRWGADAIDPDGLGRLTNKELERRVKAIKTQIKKNDLVGERGYRAELNDWMKFAKKFRPTVTALRCVAPKVVATYPVNFLFGYSERRPITLILTHTEGGYFLQEYVNGGL